MKSTQVIAVIVVFQPELEALYQLVLATAEQVEGIVIVNNSPKVSLNDLLQAADTPIHLITLEENMGIAYAQNIGIEWAISQNAQYVLLLDQDSTPLPGMGVHVSPASSEKRELSSASPTPAHRQTHQR